MMSLSGRWGAFQHWCVMNCGTFQEDELRSLVKAIVEGEVAAEREACAKLADERSKVCQEATKELDDDADRIAERRCAIEASHIASLIRNRGKK